MILNQFRLDGKAAIITGASRGIGLALAEALAEAGCETALVARDREALEKNAVRLTRKGARSVAVPADVADDAQLDTIIPRTLHALEHLDILVHSAGITTRHPSENYPMEDWDRVMQVNLRSVFRLTQQAARIMIEQQAGKIIFVASLTSEVASVNIPAYTASKGAIRQLTRQLASDWAKYNIHVNAIGPGFIETQMTEALRNDPERNRQIVERTALKRWGKPEDLKGAAVYLASPASDYVTGQILYVDGGYLAR